jgi:hypothetical protein
MRKSIEQGIKSINTMEPFLDGDPRYADRIDNGLRPEHFTRKSESVPLASNL